MSITSEMALLSPSECKKASAERSTLWSLDFKLKYKQDSYFMYIFHYLEMLCETLSKVAYITLVEDKRITSILWYPIAMLLCDT